MLSPAIKSLTAVQSFGHPAFNVGCQGQHMLMTTAGSCILCDTSGKLLHFMLVMSRSSTSDSLVPYRYCVAQGNCCNCICRASSARSLDTSLTLLAINPVYQDGL